LFLKPFLANEENFSCSGESRRSKMGSPDDERWRSRNNDMEELVRERDGGCCVMTGMSEMIPGRFDKHSFEWFVTMEQNMDPKLSVYRATEIKDTGLLGIFSMGREEATNNGSFRRISSFNQVLFIGTSQPRPAKVFLKLHELISRIVHMRGAAEPNEEDADDDREEIDSLLEMEEMSVEEK
ncbi:hypothetical protein HDU99_006038, partial [Rhizoclosmatium hyalinum]